MNKMRMGGTRISVSFAVGSAYDRASQFSNHLCFQFFWKLIRGNHSHNDTSQIKREGGLDSGGSNSNTRMVFRAGTPQKPCIIVPTVDALVIRLKTWEERILTWIN
jgi:hypothetical protein